MKKSKSRKITDRAFREVHDETPAAVRRTMMKKGKAAGEKQRVAIALDKARKRGARIPKA